MITQLFTRSVAFVSINLILLAVRRDEYLCVIVIVFIGLINDSSDRRDTVQESITRMA